jgi:CDP-glycerol glycerophosphotransferase (TagB/SpsB family)
LSRFAWIDVSVHPRNRTDRTPTGASMPRADIVVADFGTTVYEAWALGKPVIFPRWLLADRIAEYMPSSAESHIFSERIGYHPDSFDELVDIVRSGPVLTPDVRSFMDDYLAPQYFGASSARVAEVLSAIAAQPRTRRS